MFVLKTFLAYLLVWWNNHQICVFFMSTWKFQHVVAYATVWYSKTCINHKRNLRIDWKFGNKLILSVSIELCHRNSMLGSQNGLLIYYMYKNTCPEYKDWCKFSSCLGAQSTLVLFQIIEPKAATGLGCSFIIRYSKTQLWKSNVVWSHRMLRKSIATCYWSQKFYFVEISSA